MTLEQEVGARSGWNLSQKIFVNNKWMSWLETTWWRMCWHVKACRRLVLFLLCVCVSGFNYHHPPQLNPRRHYIFTITNKPLNTTVSFSSWIYHLEKVDIHKTFHTKEKCKKIQLTFIFREQKFRSVRGRRRRSSCVTSSSEDLRWVSLYFSPSSSSSSSSSPSSSSSSEDLRLVSPFFSPSSS